MTGSSWIRQARSELLRLASAPGWGYRQGGSPHVEPTALGCLALLASAPSEPDSTADRIVDEAARWLASIQQPDGALGLSAALRSPEWSTPYAMLVWSNLEGFNAQSQKAAEWLLGRRGHTFKKDFAAVAGGDSSIAGWPWVAGTYSWLEPTAIAVLALQRQGLAGHERTLEGLRLIRDRVISSGGWNFGSNMVYSTNFRPQPAETGIALLALRSSGAPEEMIGKACAFLERALPTVHSAQSLGWGLLGLTAWGRRPEAADQWLAESYARAAHHPEAAPQVSYLLLAAGERSLILLGAAGPK